MKKIIFTLILIILVTIFVATFAIFQTPDNGQHTGYITSVEKTGLIIQTYTVFVKTDPQSSQEDSYCVTNPNTINDLQNYEKERLPVTIFYSAPLILWKWQCSSPNSIINSVTTVSPATTTTQ
jgi:hypothetical protein